MRLLCVHPSALMYSKVFLRLEPLGLELVAEAARCRGHAVRLIDLQAASHAEYFRLLDEWRPDVVAFGLSYLANVPEVIDLAKQTKARTWQNALSGRGCVRNDGGFFLGAGSRSGCTSGRDETSKLAT